MAWRVARSLDVLVSQLNALAPRRSKVSDGAIGDTAHASRSRASDHNPWYPLPDGGIVTARDFTHDPAGGLDCHWLAERLVASRDARIKYVIWNRRILDTRPGSKPWQWVSYTGTNPHAKHLHLSVMDNSTCDDPRPWNLDTTTPSAPTQEDDMPDVRQIWEDYRVQVLDSNGTAIPGYAVSPQEMLAQINRVAWLILGKVNNLTDDERNILAAVAGISSGSVDVAHLAAALTTSLGPNLARQVVDEMSGRLTE